jgi:hypothetical protein
LDLEHTDALFELMDDTARYDKWLRGERDCPKTGYDVACYISGIDALKQTPVVIHSMNPAGSKLMQEVLPEAHRVQFPILKGLLC